MKFINTLFGIILASASFLTAQQFQTQDLPPLNPLYAVNAKYTNGVAPGYAPTGAATGLTLTLSSGTATFNHAVQNYAGGTLTMSNGTNYVYLDETTGNPTSSTSTFTGAQFPIAIVTASGGNIVSIVDVRTMFTNASTGTFNLTTTGNSGPSTVSGGTLNVPIYTVGANLQMAVLPPASGKFITIYPTGYTITGQTSYSTATASNTAGQIADAGCSGVGTCSQPLITTITWTFTLPSYINPVNVTGVYASGIASTTNFVAGGYAPSSYLYCYQSATTYIMFTGLSANSPQQQYNVHLTGVTGSQISTITCDAHVSATDPVQGSITENVPAIVLQVADSVDTPPNSNYTYVEGPLYYNSALNQIGLDASALTGGFPITLGSTSIAASSTTTAVTGLTVNGVSLTTGDANTTYLNGAGVYTTPATGFPITLGSTAIASGSTTTSIAGLTVNGVNLNATGAATLYLDKSGNYSTPSGSGGTPCTSVASSLQYDNAGVFGCTAGITYPGTAGMLNIANTETYTGGASYGYSTVNTNAVNLNYYMEQGSDNSISSFAAGALIPSGATMHQAQAIFGVVENHSTSVNGVGAYLLGICYLTGTSCWGTNDIAGDVGTPSTQSTEIGHETDLGAQNTDDIVTGYLLNSTFTAQPVTAIGIDIANTGGSGQWTGGIKIRSGAVISGGIGVDIGSVSKLGASSPSALLCFEAGNLGSYSPSCIQSDGFGILDFTPFSGISLFTGQLRVSGVATSPSTSPICPNGTNGSFTTSGCSGGGLSGMTAGQVPIAATASTVTSSEALAGTGAGIVTGPISGTTAGHVVTEQGTTGQIQDSGTALSSLAPLASPTFTGTVTLPITGSTQCLHVSTLGVVSGTGSDCGASGGGSNVTVNGGSTLSTANFNGTTPAAGSNGINVTFQTSGSNVSAEVVGDGNSAHFLNGTGAFSTPSGGGPGAWTNITGSGQITASGCTQSASTGGYCSISGSSTTAFTLSVIPGTYYRLQLIAWGQGTTGTPYVTLNFNSDTTGGHYFLNGVYQSGSGAVSGNALATAAACYLGQLTTSGVGQIVSDIPFYADTTFSKAATSRNSQALAASNSQNTDMSLSCGWNQTTAITSITVNITTGDFVAGTKFMLLAQN